MLIRMFGRTRFSRLSRLSCAVCSMALALLTTAAHAQEAAPQPNLLKAPPVWLGLLVMFILLAMAITVSLMPSKRSHQD
jgi:hypothetical protein